MRMADRHLVDKCLNGDSAAFGMLVDRYKESVYALAYSRLRNFHDAEDVTQEAFTKAYQKLRTLRRWDEFHVWIYAITSNLCKDWIRAKSRRPDREFIADHSARSLSRYPGNLRDEVDMLEMLHAAMDSLPESYQQVLTLHYLGGMDGTEIAQFLGMSPSAIWQRLSRARASLKKEILDMMSETYERNRLRAGFTFRVLEMVKRVKIEPLSPRVLPWGISIAAGIIIGILGIGSHLDLTNTEYYTPISSLSAMPEAQNIGDFPVDVVNVPDVPVISGDQSAGDGSGDMYPYLQALFMASQGQGDTWMEKADMPTARQGLSTCTVNGKIYAIGGYVQGGILHTVEEYDPKADRWTRKADMPTARYYLATCEANGKIYAIGGTMSENEMDFSTVEEYDPVKDKWTEKADMPTARHWLSASFANGKIYAIGGLVGNPMHHVSTVEEYDPVEDKWTGKANLPRRLHTISTSVVNGRIYGFAGVDMGIIIPTVYEYDPLIDKWTAKADMPTKRWRVCTSVVNGRVYAIGGLDDLFNKNPNSRAVPTVEEYDPVADKWTARTDMPMPRYNHACSAVDGKIYVFGGWRNDVNEDISSTVLEYDTGFSGEKVDPEGKLPTTWGGVRTVMGE